MRAGRPCQHAPQRHAAFTVVTERLNAERRLFKEKLAAGVTPLHALLDRHMQAFITCTDGWQLHGQFARWSAYNALPPLCDVHVEMPLP